MKNSQNSGLPMKCRYSISASIRDWNEFERIKKQNWVLPINSAINFKVIEVIERIDMHLLAINSIVEFVKMVDDIYDED